MQNLQTLCPESNFRNAPNWPKLGKMTVTSQFADMTSSSILLMLFCFSCQVQLLVQISCQYHHCFFYTGLLGSKSEIPSSEFWPISGDWDELGIPNLARISLIRVDVG